MSKKQAEPSRSSFNLQKSQSTIRSAQISQIRSRDSLRKIRTSKGQTYREGIRRSRNEWREQQLEQHSRPTHLLDSSALVHKDDFLICPIDLFEFFNVTQSSPFLRMKKRQGDFRVRWCTNLVLVLFLFSLSFLLHSSSSYQFNRIPRIPPLMFWLQLLALTEKSWIILLRHPIVSKSRRFGKKWSDYLFSFHLSKSTPLLSFNFPILFQSFISNLTSLKNRP